MAAGSPTTLPLHRLDVETYDRMVACGALEGQRVELLEGAIVDMSPQSPAHALVIERLTRHLARAPGRLRVQLPIAVARDCEPEPDLAVIDTPPSSDRHPNSASLIVEVAVSSQAIDRNVKARLYAAAGIATYWLVDVPCRGIEVRTRPGADGYESHETYRQGAVVPSPLDGVEDLDVAALLGDLVA